jgi:hypothetical protein
MNFNPKSFESTPTKTPDLATLKILFQTFQADVYAIEQ